MTRLAATLALCATTATAFVPANLPQAHVAQRSQVSCSAERAPIGRKQFVNLAGFSAAAILGAGAANAAESGPGTAPGFKGGQEAQATRLSKDLDPLTPGPNGTKESKAARPTNTGNLAPGGATPTPSQARKNGSGKTDDIPKDSANQGNPLSGAFSKLPKADIPSPTPAKKGDKPGLFNL